MVEKNIKEQIEFCEILDTWYFNCKGQFKDIHPLGMRKEDLKAIVCLWLQSKEFKEPVCEHQFNIWDDKILDWKCRLCFITRRQYLGLQDL